MRAYKGFTPNPDGTLQCLSKTYREGETYTEPSGELCSHGMHACLMPIDVLAYYPPAGSVYHEVEVDDDLNAREGSDSKVASKSLRVGARLSIAGLVNAQVEAVWERCTVEPGNQATGYRGAASSTGDQGAASSTGYQGAASSTGTQGAASAMGKYSVALAAGFEGRAKGAEGCVLSLIEREDWTKDGRILAAKSVIVGRKAGGQVIKSDTWYSLRGGKVVEVDADGEVIP